MLIIAHRGDTIHYPENTFKAFESAFELGADGIELDIHLYKNDLIVVHDFLFNRSKKHPKFEEILREIHDKGRIEIEVKAWDMKILSNLKQILSQYPNDDFELTTSEIPLASHARQVFPQVRIGLIMGKHLFEDWMNFEVVCGKIIGWAKMSGANVVHLPYLTIEQFGKGRLVDKIHQAGIKVHSHIFKDVFQQKRLGNIKRWGVDQCTVDDVVLCSRPIQEGKNMVKSN